MRKTILEIAIGALLVAPAFAGSGSPVTPVPADRWGDLEPVSVLVDSTRWVEGEPGRAIFPFDLDVEGTTLYVAGGTGIQLFDVSNPALPVPFQAVAGEGTMQANELDWPHSDKDFYIRGIDVPAGEREIAVTRADEHGLIVWNTANPRSLNWHYQDAGSGGRYIVSVYATRLAEGRLYAFAIANKAGLILYDLTAAATLTRCKENTAAETGCGVFEGLLSIPGTSISSKVTGLGGLIAVQYGATGIRLYRIGGPAGFSAAAPRLSGFIPGSTAGDVALWGSGETVYLAALGSSYVNRRIVSTLYVYDVSCAATGFCAAMPPPVATYDATDTLSSLSKMTTLKVSTDAGKTYLYVGNENAGPLGGNCVEQRQYLLDLTDFDPTAPPTLADMDVSPPQYWSWYYQECGGSPGMRPLRGLVSGGHLYQAAYSYADAHEVVSAPPPPPPPPPPEECPPPPPCPCECPPPPDPPPDPPPPQKDIFADGFESGDTSRWVRP